jgi:hypothetical protein
MNLSNTIRGMALEEEKAEVELTESSRTGERFQSAEAELAAYAKKSGGDDKKDFMDVAKMLGQIGRVNILQSGQILSRLNRKLSDMDTDPRDKVYSILKAKGLMESLNEAPEDKEPASPDEASMAIKQAKFICYVGEELIDYIKNGKEFPEWMQNKLSGLHTQAMSVHSAMGGDYDDKNEEVEIEEAYKTPAEAKAYEDGKKAVAKKVSYDDNPNKKGTKEYTAWSKGHNDARAKLIAKRHVKEDVDLQESPMVSMTIPNVTSDMASKLEKTAKANNVEYSRSGRTVVLKGKRIDMTSVRTKMGIAQTNLKMVPVNEEVELEEDFYNVVYRDKSGKVQGEKEFDSKSAAEKYAKLGNSRDKVGGKYTVNLVRDGGMGRRNEEVEMNEAYLNKSGTGPSEEGYHDAGMWDKERAQQLAKAKGGKISKDPSGRYTVRIPNRPMREDVDFDELFESTFEEEALSVEETLKAIIEGKMDKVNKKELKKDFDDRKDKDIDNDGDTDDSDEYLHKKRQAISKSMKGEDEGEGETSAPKSKSKDDHEDEENEKKDQPVGKSGKQTKIDTKPDLDEEKGEEMTSAELAKKDEIMKELEKKETEFVKKYGDRAKEVMARTAIKMAKKHA